MEDNTEIIISRKCSGNDHDVDLDMLNNMFVNIKIPLQNSFSLKCSFLVKSNPIDSVI